jgi:hypothetical protein
LKDGAQIFSELLSIEHVSEISDIPRRDAFGSVRSAGMMSADRSFDSPAKCTPGHKNDASRTPLLARPPRQAKAHQLPICRQKPRIFSYFQNAFGR